MLPYRPVPLPEKIDKYEVLEQIGEGGGGVVYKARDPFLKRLVAIKLCQVETPELAQRFAREAEIAARLSHLNIVVVFDFGFLGERPYIVQELLPGEDLTAVIRRKDPLAQAARLGYLIQVARALSFAHSQGVIHRDIKPSNVRLLDAQRAKVLDFGIARLLDASTQLTRAGTTMGTAGYLSPEQIRGQEVDFRADIFSFGVLAYEFLSYERPYKASSITDLFRLVLEADVRPIRDLHPEISEDIEFWIGKCLRRDRNDRWESFEELIPMLVASREGLPGDTARIRASTPAPKPEERAEGSRSTETASAVFDSTMIVPKTPTPTPVPAAGRTPTPLPESQPSGRRLSTALRLLVAAVVLAVLGLAAWLLIQRGFLPSQIEALFSPPEIAAPQPTPVPAAPPPPAAATSAELTIEAIPWGTIHRVLDLSRGEVIVAEPRPAPLRLAVAPGKYEVVIVHKDDEPVNCIVEVESEQSGNCTATFATRGADDYFREIGWFR